MKNAAYIKYNIHWSIERANKVFYNIFIWTKAKDTSRLELILL